MTRAFRVAIALLSGIGLGGALAFLEKGAHVVLVSRSLEKMQAAVPKEYKRLPARQEGKLCMLAELCSLPKT